MLKTNKLSGARKVDPIHHVYFISGGRTSAYMVATRTKTPYDVFIFNDTEREHPLTYKFLDDIEKNEGIFIHRVKNKETFSQLVFRKKSVPNRTWRYCTQELKRRSSARYLKTLGILRYHSYIGFRFDEAKRVYNARLAHIEKKVILHHPLFDAKINKEMVLAFWRSKNYDLQIPHILGNCDLCFMKGKNAIIAILRYFPELAKKWIADEDSTPGKTFIKGISYRQMLTYATQMQTMFPLDDLNYEFSCPCGS